MDFDRTTGRPASLESLSQLVGTTGLLSTATDSVEPRYHVVGLHTSHEGCNALQVAVTAAHYAEILYDIFVIDEDSHHACAHTPGLIIYLFHFSEQIKVSVLKIGYKYTAFSGNKEISE